MCIPILVDGPAKLAQMVGCWTHNRRVVGSNPPRAIRTWFTQSYPDLVQLASKSSESEGRPNRGTQVHAPTAAALYVAQRIEIVQE